MSALFKFPFFVFAIILLALNSCGLQYIPTELPEDVTGNRRVAIESQISRDFQKSEYQYYSVAFGTTEVVKPFSYKRLDSLYQKKYVNENRGVTDNALEQDIAQQRLIVANDTNPIYYIETHVFELRKKDTSEFYSAKITTDIKDNIKKTEILESVIMPSKYSEMYKTYVYQESFLRPGTTAGRAELDFYTMFKDQSNTLIGEKRDRFVVHSLGLMKLAHDNKTLQTVEVLKFQVLKTIKENYQVDIANPIFNKIEELTNEQNDVVGYNVNVTLNLTENGITSNRNFYLQLNEYMEIEKIDEL